MLKSKPFKACLLIAAIVFCLTLKGFSENSCPPPYDCPPNISTIPETAKYPQDWLLKWDPNNPQVINRNGSVAVNVISGYPPYSWSVSGTGFRLKDDTTQDLSNTLYADNTACVTTVSVTDRRGQIVSGDVRCSCGGWVRKGSICGLEGTYDTKSYSYWSSGWVYIKEQGNQRQEQTTVRSWGDCDEEGACESRCTTNDGLGNIRCNTDFGCEVCIAPYEGWCGASGYCWCTMHLYYYEYECPL